MYKKAGMVILAASLVGVFLFGFTWIQQNNSSYSNAMEINWNIRLPDGYQCSDSAVEDPDSVLGDGDRYHALQYEEEPAFDDTIVWGTACCASKEAEAILQNLKVKSDLNLQGAYGIRYCFREKDNNRLWMVYEENSKMLYIIERLM